MTNSETSGTAQPLRLSGETVAAMLSRGETLPPVIEVEGTIPIRAGASFDLGTTCFRRVV